MSYESRHPFRALTSFFPCTGWTCVSFQEGNKQIPVITGYNLWHISHTNCLSPFCNYVRCVVTPVNSQKVFSAGVYWSHHRADINKRIKKSFIVSFNKSRTNWYLHTLSSTLITGTLKSRTSRSSAELHIIWMIAIKRSYSRPGRCFSYSSAGEKSISWTFIKLHCEAFSIDITGIPSGSVI